MNLKQSISWLEERLKTEYDMFGSNIIFIPYDELAEETDGKFESIISYLETRGLIKDSYAGQSFGIHNNGKPVGFISYSKALGRVVDSSYEVRDVGGDVTEDDFPHFGAPLTLMRFEIDETYFDKVSRGEKVKERKLQKIKGKFFFDGKEIVFDKPNSQHYIILDILYGVDGSSKEIKYKDMAKGMRGRGINIDEKKEGSVILNAVHNGLYRRNKDLPKDLLKVVRGVGIRLNNDLVSIY